MFFSSNFWDFLTMDLSEVAIAGAREMLVVWAVGAVFWRFIPHSKSICDRIELGKKILNFIGEASEWVNYDKNLEDNIQSLKYKMQHLVSLEEDVCKELEMQEFQTNKKRKSVVENWLRNVRAKDEEVRNVENKMANTRALSRFLFRAWLGSCVEKKKKEVSKLCDQRTGFEQLVLNACHLSRMKLPTCELVGQVTNRSKEEIWSHLTSQEVKILGVQGDRGMGKTEIMKHIYNRIIDNPGLFDKAFYVSIKEDYSVFELQAAIGVGLDLLDFPTAEHSRASRINEALKLAKRFVLILDGLRSDYSLEEVGIPVGQNDGKLVVVAHCIKVCQRMPCEPVIRLERLPYDDSRKLFMNRSVELSPEIEGIAQQIIQRCNGVPLRIIEASKELIQVEDISVWRTMLRKLKNKKKTF